MYVHMLAGFENQDNLKEKVKHRWSRVEMYETQHQDHCILGKLHLENHVDYKIASRSDSLSSTDC